MDAIGVIQEHLGNALDAAINAIAPPVSSEQASSFSGKLEAEIVRLAGIINAESVSSSSSSVPRVRASAATTKRWTDEENLAMYKFIKQLYEGHDNHSELLQSTVFIQNSGWLAFIDTTEGTAVKISNKSAKAAY